MGGKRYSDDIKLGALYGADWPNFSGMPRPDPVRGPVFVSHEELLRRDLEIINARTVAELGRMPPEELSAQIRCKPDVPYWPMPAPRNPDNMEDVAMKLSNVAALAVFGASGALTACDTNGMRHQKDMHDTHAEPRAMAAASAHDLARGAPKDRESGKKTHASDYSTRPAYEETKKRAEEPERERTEMASSIGFRSSYDKCAETSSGATSEILDCIASEFEYQVGKLNTSYRKLLTRLSGSKREALIAEQNRWLSNKERDCKWDAQTEGQGQLIDARSCELNITAVRANELERALKDFDNRQEEVRNGQ